MRKYIFTTTDSQVPDLRFAAANAVCPAGPAAQEFTCQVAGNLTIRGTSRPFTITLNLHEQSGSPLALRASGDAVVRLSDYGIAAPSQFGVTASNDVQLNLDFPVRQRPAATSSLERQR